MNPRILLTVILTLALLTSSQYCFSEDAARQQTPNKFGFIDKTGKLVIPCQFDGAAGFSEGLAGVVQKGKFGYVDRRGKVVIPFQFKEAGDFAEGLAPVAFEETGKDQPGR